MNLIEIVQAISTSLKPDSITFFITKITQKPVKSIKGQELDLIQNLSKGNIEKEHEEQMGQIK